MSDLKLLSPDQPTPLERRLMNAASSEAPSPEQRMRVRQALGLPALVAAPPLPRISRSTVWVKGALAGAVVVSALWLPFRARTSAPLPAQYTAAKAPAEPLAAPSAPLALSPEPVVQSLPALEPGSTAPAVLPKRARGAHAASPEASADLTEQLRLIEAARAAVAARDPSLASQALGSYASQFPRGAFSQEASVLRIETIDLQGKHTQAAALAKAFLARHPNSPHVGLVQRIAGNP